MHQVYIKSPQATLRTFIQSAPQSNSFNLKSTIKFTSISWLRSKL